MEGLVWALVTIVLASVIVTMVCERIVFNATFKREREETFRRTLRMWNWSESEIDQAVEGQGWS